MLKMLSFFLYIRKKNKINRKTIRENRIFK